ncbi:peptidase family m48 domain-containing protein [Sarocladium implicatum]|nr:peptidase family m48 domain-containing protein [Sarocladium implicatum]
MIAASRFLRRPSPTSNRTLLLLLRTSSPLPPRFQQHRLLSSTARLAARYPNREPITIRTTAREISSEPIKTILITRRYIIGVVAAAVVVYFAFSQTVPVTHRRSFNVVSDRLVEWWNGNLAEKIIADVHRQGGKFLPERDPRARAVHRVMQRLIPYSGIADQDWQVFVIHDDRTANAFVIPGGKVFVHSGLLNVCHNEDALAAVLGHEIAHTTASHPGERITQLGAFWLTLGSLFFLRGPWSGALGLSIASAMGLSTFATLEVELPMSRSQEMEADYVGLMMMAEACYDPRQAVGLWQRFEALQKSRGMEIPEFLSTHPANAHRIQNMRDWMDEALAKRQSSDCQGTVAFADRFREAIRRRQAKVNA